MQCLWVVHLLYFSSLTHFKYYSWLQVANLIAELASVAAAEMGIVFDEGMEERLCAYSRTVSHFPTAVKEASPET